MWFMQSRNKQLVYWTKIFDVTRVHGKETLEAVRAGKVATHENVFSLNICKGNAYLSSPPALIKVLYFSSLGIPYLLLTWRIYQNQQPSIQT